MSDIPKTRIRSLNDRSINPDGEYVLYWMIANRRVHSNYSLDHAIAICRESGKPLVILEALRCDYQWASDRLHRFVLQGMADNRRTLKESPALYYCYVEPSPGKGRGLLEQLASRAVAVVTDDFPCFFLPAMTSAAAERLPIRVESVDSNGLLPMRATDRVFARAYDFRRWLQINLRPYLSQHPHAAPLEQVALPHCPNLPSEITERWPEASDAMLHATPDGLCDLPIDHDVGPAAFDGGFSAAQTVLDRFLDRRLSRYVDSRNDPNDEAASGLSPYLHFGHVSVHEIFSRILTREEWLETDLADSGSGAREGWWGMSPEAESFLDELITWRELGYNMCSKRDDYDQFDSLPVWAQQTLRDHADDLREFKYTIEEFEAAATHDELWNAAQRQLVRDGRMHNYMRMLWGKKILEWSPTPQDALETMIHLNNKYAVDGRNPNSYSGIFWVLGRYDRAWGPERPVFGKIRYMSSDNTARKLRVKPYLERYAATSRGTLWNE